MEAFGPYEIVQFVAATDMARVYLAQDRRSGERVALKVLAADMNEARFTREAEVLASLRHPSIVRYVDHGTSNGDAWLATEWLDGEPLSARLERERMTLGEILAMANLVVQALAFLHARGIVHRDVKPGNVFLVASDPRRPRLLDFGIARDGERANLTAAHVIMGTPQYMPPEQALDARSADARADVFALGAMLFHCVTGRPLYTADSVAQLFAEVALARVPRMSSLVPYVPEELDDLVARATSADRAERHASALELLADLEKVPRESYCEGESVTRIRVARRDVTSRVSG